MVFGFGAQTEKRTTPSPRGVAPCRGNAGLDIAGDQSGS